MLSLGVMIEEMRSTEFSDLLTKAEGGMKTRSALAKLRKTFAVSLREARRRRGNYRFCSEIYGL